MVLRTAWCSFYFLLDPGGLEVASSISQGKARKPKYSTSHEASTHHFSFMLLFTRHVPTFIQLVRLSRAWLSRPREKQVEGSEIVESRDMHQEGVDTGEDQRCFNHGRKFEMDGCIRRQSVG